MTSTPLEDDAWLAERVAFEQLSENKVVLEAIFTAPGFVISTENGIS
jgi:hypothetical protein